MAGNGKVKVEYSKDLLRDEWERIGDRAEVRFTFPNGHFVDVCIRDRGDGPQIDVHQ